jgi:THO complex subunit 2
VVSLGDPVVQFWYQNVRRYILRALPLMRGSAVCFHHTGTIVGMFDTPARWRLWADWRESYDRHPELRVRRAEADHESKSILRRLGRNMTASLLCSITKLGNSDPCLFFTIAVNQIQSYENMGPIVIPQLVHQSPLALDVLVFVTLDALSNENKPRVKDDGVNTSDWINSEYYYYFNYFFLIYLTNKHPFLDTMIHRPCLIPRVALQALPLHASLRHPIRRTPAPKQPANRDRCPAGAHPPDGRL